MNLKNNKGITLIALIITIIILLILAVVSVKIVTDSGIITKAQTATDTYKKAEEEEKVRLAYLEYKTATANGETAEFKVEGASVEVNGTYGWYVTFTETGNKYEIDKDGKIGTSNTWTVADDGTITSETGITSSDESVKSIKVGDYVNYDPTAGADSDDLTYTSSSDLNGYSNQSFDASTYKSAGFGWRVLGVENGKITLISEEFVGPGDYTESSRTYYRLQGQNGFINGVSELNKISAIFGHGTGAESARSITVDDVNAITGYNPSTAKCGKGNFWEYGNEVTYTRGDSNALSSSSSANTSSWSGTQSTFNYFDESTRSFKPLSTSGESVKIKSTYYWYNVETLSTSYTDIKYGVDSDGNYSDIYKMMFGDFTVTDSTLSRTFNGTTVPNYWLASEYANACSYYVIWGLRNVYGGYVDSNYLYNSYGYAYYNNLGVRPVVSLKSTVSLKYSGTASDNSDFSEWTIQ